jgi:hypothetical protein
MAYMRESPKMTRENAVEKQTMVRGGRFIDLAYRAPIVFLNLRTGIAWVSFSMSAIYKHPFVQNHTKPFRADPETVIKKLFSEQYVF